MLIWKKFKFGVFDADGTLFNNIEISADAFEEITKKFFLPSKEARFDSSARLDSKVWSRLESRRARKTYLETNGMNLKDQFKLIFEKRDIKYNDSLIKKLNKDFFELRDNWENWQNAPIFPGVESLLKILKANGARLFISSGSNTDEIIFRLKKTGILEYFDLVLGGEKTPKGQKHIDHFAKFCGLAPQNFASQTFFVSDGPNDMALAKKAGIFAIGITNTVSPDKLKSAGADLVISSFNELAKLEF